MGGGPHKLASEVFDPGQVEAEPGSLSSELRAVLGEAAFVKFCEDFGGTRVYVPHKMREGNAIVRALGREAATRLSRAFAPATIRAPLARRQRALHYRAEGLSNTQIARKLGMTLSGVLKLFKKLTVEQDDCDR